MASPIVGKISYHAGAAGTIALDKGEKILRIRALGAAGATLVILGGDTIPIPAAYTFADEIDSRTEEYMGDGTKTLVFTSTLSYYVKTLKKA